VNVQRLDTARRPSKRAVVDGTLSCLALGIAAGNIIALALFAAVFTAYALQNPAHGLG
jgi:hypothetical protein